MQIADIMKKAAELKEEVKDYQSDRLQRAEEYFADLMAKAESLERIQTEIKISLQENSSTSIIAERKSIQGALVNAQNINTTTAFHCLEQTLFGTGGKIIKQSNI